MHGGDRLERGLGSFTWMSFTPPPAKQCQSGKCKQDKERRQIAPLGRPRVTDGFDPGGCLEPGPEGK